MSKRSRDHFREVRETGAPLSRHSMNQRRASLSIDGGRRVYGDSQTHVKRDNRLSRRAAKDALSIGQASAILEKGFSGARLTQEESEYLDKVLSEHETCMGIFEANGSRATVTVLDLSELRDPFESFGEPSIFIRGKER